MTAEPIEPQWLAEVYDEAFCTLHGIAWGEPEPVVTVTPQPVVGYLLGCLLVTVGLLIGSTTPHLSGGTILAVLLITAGGGICVRVAIVAGRGAGK
ncbi:hypothetical protein QUV83_16240 [Cellulomonas cellasea]|uniref:hypothetical protein n=1 Tax=Cellulomonas cellasea TaxID=43670 RepID=UPI0025A371DB|nr:hypothetical protein [Cellulomonas cellasea]MDM8086325.1 hypothetical protein [Cellulomonas cellasea]